MQIAKNLYYSVISDYPFCIWEYYYLGQFPITIKKSYFSRKRKSIFQKKEKFRFE